MTEQDRRSKTLDRQRGTLRVKSKHLLEGNPQEEVRRLALTHVIQAKCVLRSSRDLFPGNGFVIDPRKTATRNVIGRDQKKTPAIVLWRGSAEACMASLAALNPGLSERGAIRLWRCQREIVMPS